MEEEQLAAVVWILLVATVVSAAASQPAGDNSKIEGVFATETGNVTVTLEVADTPPERKEGLMDREKLGENQGMLFIFPDERDRTFWMKDTLIPLDIIFIDADHKVVDIDQAEPEPSVHEAALSKYRSDSPAKYVVEVNQGFADRNDVETGDRLLLR